MSLIYTASRAVLLLPLIFFYTSLVIMKILFGIFLNPKNFLGTGQKAQQIRNGKPPPKRWTDPTLGTHGFLRLKVSLFYSFKLWLVFCSENLLN